MDSEYIFHQGIQTLGESEQPDKKVSSNTEIKMDHLIQLTTNLLYNRCFPNNRRPQLVMLELR